MTGHHQTDFHAWSLEQATAIRSRRLSGSHLLRIAEELENLGRSERKELESRLTVLLLHLLKCRYQPERRSRSWDNTIRTQRFKLKRHLDANPSLKAVLADAFVAAYYEARDDASSETNLPLETFPETSPWTFEQAMSEAP